MNVVSNESTPCLIGLDVSYEYGLVIDYHYNRVCSHVVKRSFFVQCTPTGRVALEVMPSKSEEGQHPASSHALSARRWDQQEMAQEKGAFALETSTFLLDPDHEHTSTSEDDLLKLSGMLEDTQTWNIYRATSSSAPSLDNVMSRTTIDDIIKS